MGGSPLRVSVSPATLGKILLIHWILLRSFGIAFGHGASKDEDHDTLDDDDDPAVWWATQHVQDSRRRTQVNLEGLDFLAENAASLAVQRVVEASLTKRLAKIFQKTRSPECRAKIVEHLGHFINAIGLEECLPFSEIQFKNQCGEPVYMWNDMPEGMHPGMIQNRTYQPPRNESVYLDDPSDLILLYGILAHHDANATIRLIDALDEPGHIFVIHVDGKEEYETTQVALREYAHNRDHVHLLEHPYRVRVAWGGFSMVNATLQLLQYAFAVNQNHEPLTFHKFVHLSSSTYPLASNTEIRHRLASFPLDANFLHVVLQPTRPAKKVWNYFVECDDAVHRIYQLPSLQEYTAGVDMFTSSQWFIISHEFAKYLSDPPPGSFVENFLIYIQHVVVADETFFGTVLRNTEFCHKHHNRNWLHLQFDRWESELPAGKRDDRKCPMPNPDHCGRSPTLMSVDYADLLELSDELFARKFDDRVDTQVKDIIDVWRRKRESLIRSGNVTADSVGRSTQMEFEGYGTLIVAKETVQDPTPLCLGLGPTGNEMRLTPCFHSWVPATLGEDWETGAVIQKETPLQVRWEIGPCTTDGSLHRSTSGEIVVTKGNYSSTGPRCMLKQMDGIRAGRCYDGHPESLQPGGPIQVYPCVQQWYQFVSFGEGENAPVGSMYSTIPSHVVRQIHNLGHDQHPFMCFGVFQRGDSDEVDWNDKEYMTRKRKQKSLQRSSPKPKSFNAGTLAPLSEWEGERLMLTQCTNMKGVIEWVFVPYILELEDDDDTQGPVDQGETSFAELEEDGEHGDEL